MTFENSPSKLAAVDQPLIHLNSADAVASAASPACAAPLTTKDAPPIQAIYFPIASDATNAL